MASLDRRKEIIDVCLKTFMEQGLSNTPTKDLCKALNMQTGGIFYHFETKDEIILACVEEARCRIEKDLFGTALKDIYYPEKLVKDLHDRAVKMRPLMKFFVSVCSDPRFEELIQPSLTNLSVRYKYYIIQFAEKLDCKPDDVAPYVYTVINTMLSYMLFGKKSFVAPQLTMVYNVLKSMLERRNNNLLKNTKTNL